MHTRFGLLAAVPLALMVLPARGEERKPVAAIPTVIVRLKAIDGLIADGHYLAKLAGKDNINRTRPGALNEKAYRLEKGHSDDGRLRSMPSGHSAGIVAVAGAIAADYPRALLPVAAASVAVGAAQLPSRNHYLSDVVVGAGIGLVVAGLSRLLIPPQPAPG